METKREIIMRQIGAKIAYQRKFHGYSQEQLSQKLHLGKTVLSRVERGKYNQNLSLNMLLDIADWGGEAASSLPSPLGKADRAAAPGCSYIACLRRSPTLFHAASTLSAPSGHLPLEGKALFVGIGFSAYPVFTLAI